MKRAAAPPQAIIDVPGVTVSLSKGKIDPL
jgi:hypothetical protein